MTQTKLKIQGGEIVPPPHFPRSTQPVFRGSSVPFLQKVFKLLAVLPAVIQMLNDAVVANCARQICTLKTEQQSYPHQCSHLHKQWLSWEQMGKTLFMK